MVIDGFAVARQRSSSLDGAAGKSASGGRDDG